MSLGTPVRVLLFTGVALGIGLLPHIAIAQDAAPANGPDPKEIPLPPIKTPIGRLPGVTELPVRKEMPEVLVTNGGSKVTTRSQWQRRREEMRRTLSYYAVGQAPPPPGNVKGKVVKSETVLDGTVTYRLVHLTFGPAEKLGLDIGIFTPAVGGPFPAIILQGGTPPGAAALPRLPQGPNQGRGENVLLLVGSAPGAEPDALRPAGAVPSAPSPRNRLRRSAPRSSAAGTRSSCSIRTTAPRTPRCAIPTGVGHSGIRAFIPPTPATIGGSSPVGPGAPHGSPTTWKPIAPSTRRSSSSPARRGTGNPPWSRPRLTTV